MRPSAGKDMNSGVRSPSGFGRAREDGAPGIEASRRRTLYAANVPTRGIHRADRGTCILPRRLFAPTSPEPAPAAPVATAPKEFRAHEGLMDVHFAPGKSEVLKGDAAALDSTAAWLKQNPHWLVLIEGYTDDRGTKDQNLAVSERRARSVMSYLVTQGVEPDRISIASYGADRPMCTEKSEGCRAKNRRVHFLVRER